MLSGLLYALSYLLAGRLEGAVVGDVYVEVQAALLNSSGDPGEELEEAIRALVEFAVLECEATPEALHQMIDRAAKKVDEASK